MIPLPKAIMLMVFMKKPLRLPDSAYIWNLTIDHIMKVNWKNLRRHLGMLKDSDLRKLPEID